MILETYNVQSTFKVLQEVDHVVEKLKILYN